MIRTCRIIQLVLFACLLCSCTQIPLKSGSSDNNQTYEVDYLFEHDGCKVYRFRDKGNYVYFTNCNGEAISIANDSTKTRIVNRTSVGATKHTSEQK